MTNRPASLPDARRSPKRCGCVLGFKRLAGVGDIPVIMPKPEWSPLTGGYRRTPFMQIGADIYCDTALICACSSASRRSRRSTRRRRAGLARILAQWADSTLFWTAMPYTMQPAGAARHVRRRAAGERKAFGADRAR